MNALAGIDYLVLAAYLCLITVIGLWHQGRQKGADDFLLAGRSMGWIPMGISIAAAFISGISYVGLPAEVMSHGLGFVLYAFSYVLVIPVITGLFLPFYSALKITTAYEYLEARFDRRVRLFCSGMFILWRLLWIAMIIYVPSLLISTVAGVPLVPAILVIGVLTTLYTAVGGLRAVIITDAIQFFVMAGGAIIAILVAVNAVPDGIAGILRVSAEHNRTMLVSFSLDPTIRITFWGALIGGFFANLTFFAVDQIVIQRYLSTRSGREMRSTFLLNCAALFAIVILLAALGLSLFAFYQTHPGSLPEGTPPDQVLLYFVGQMFPAGLRGLLVASIFAASMSTLSAGVNAVSTAIFNDFLDSTRRQSLGAGALTTVRWISAGTGLLCTVFACFVGRLGSIMEVAVRVIDGFAGPLLAIFLIGMRFRRVDSAAVLIGGVAGLLVTTAANFFSPLSFVWFSALGCLSTAAVALVAQKFHAPRVRLNSQPSSY